MKKLFFAALAAAPLCLQGCADGQVSSAAEHGLRQDLRPVCEVVAFRETSAEELDGPGGRSAVVRFESEVRWLTLEEALSSKGAAKNAQDYLQKLAYASSRLGSARAGASARVSGAALLVRTEVGWLYKGLAER